MPEFTIQELQQLRELLDKQTVASPKPSVAYDNGFVLAIPPEREGGESYRMRINSWFQLRHTFFDSENSNPDQNDIEFERLRLTFAGHVYTPDLRYFIQFDGDSDQNETSDWIDYYMTYDIGHHALCRRANALGIKFGKWKLPFSRARAESGWKLQFSDRGIASVIFDINRSLGAAIYGELPVGRNPIRYEAAVFNGFRTGGFRSVRSGDLDRNFGFSARIFNDLIGEWGSDGEPDLSWHSSPAVRWGGGIAATRVDNVDGPREFSRVRVIDSGETLASILPASVTEYSLLLAAVDVNFKYRGLSLLHEYYFRSITSFSGAAVPDLFDHGFLVQGGFFVVPKRWEWISRWSRVVGDSGTLGAANQSADEIGLGTVWYFRGHHAKLTFDASHINGAPLRDPTLNLLPGDDGMLYRTQLQIRF